MAPWFSTTTTAAAAAAAAAAFDRSQCPVIYISFAVKHLHHKCYAALLSGAQLTNNCCVSHSEFRMGVEVEDNNHQRIQCYIHTVLGPTGLTGMSLHFVKCRSVFSFSVALNKNRVW